MRNGILCGLAVIVGAFACVADEKVEPVDLVGRKGEFTIKSKGGKVETVTGDKLRLPREPIAAPRAKIETAVEEDKKESAPPPVAKKKPEGPREETAEEKAIRAADVEQLRQLRNQGGAYFYTEDNVPVSFEEIDERIATGKVEGLKVVGLHLQEWQPQTKARPESDEPEESAEPAEAEPVEQPQEVRKKY